jgi:MFS family permease
MSTVGRPATFRDVFAVVEYRAIFVAGGLSSAGDYLGKAALAALVFRATGSVLASAASLAVTFLPWLTGAPLLVALAERLERRRVLVCCDVGRMTLVALAALPGPPLVTAPALMFLAALLGPPFDAARPALLPRILTGDRYAVALSVNAVVLMATQVSGYAVGGDLAAVDPRVALAADAAPFGLSAVRIGRFVRPVDVVSRSSRRRNLLRETADGFTAVFGRRPLRWIAVVVLTTSAYAILPEGVAAGWASSLHGGARAQGLIMAATPFGATAGGLVIGRLVPPAVRHRAIRPLAMMIPLALTAAVLDPPLAIVLALAAAAGVGLALTVPANVAFVRLLPEEYRARAFGVMQGGMQLVEGTAILAGGAFATWTGPALAVGAYGLTGVIAVAVMVTRCPEETFMT